MSSIKKFGGVTLNSRHQSGDSYFDVVVGLVWSHDPKSYAGGSVCYW
jgi:hypothetical protein